MGNESTRTDEQQKLMWRNDGQVQWGFKKGPVKSSLEVIISKKKESSLTEDIVHKPIHSVFLRLVLSGIFF